VKTLEYLVLAAMSLFFLAGLVFVAIFTFPWCLMVLSVFCRDPLPYTRGGRWKLGP
jgi:hypothetical protein